MRSSGATHVLAVAPATAKTYQIVFFNRLDLFHTSPDFGERQYKSRI